MSAAERVKEASSAQQAIKWAVRMNKQMDERVAQYFSLWPSTSVCIFGCSGPQCSDAPSQEYKKNLTCVHTTLYATVVGQSVCLSVGRWKYARVNLCKCKSMQVWKYAYMEVNGMRLMAILLKWFDIFWKSNNSPLSYLHFLGEYKDSFK